MTGQPQCTQARRAITLGKIVSFDKAKGSPLRYKGCMRLLRNSLIFVAMAAIAQTGVASTYKCVGADGAVSFQDRPCANNEESSVANVAASDGLDFDPLFVPLPGGRQAALAVFKTMQSTVRENGQRATTVKIKSKPGQEPMSLQITFLANPSGQHFTDDQVSDIVLKMAQPHVEDSFERRARLWETPTEIGTAVFSTLNSREYMGKTPPRGEYRTITVGQIATSETILAFTLLTNGMDTEAFNDGMAILQTALLVDPEAAPQATAAQTPPAAPDGYRWEHCPEIKGALLAPDGWHFKKKIGRDTMAYFVSKENIDTAGEFTTGLSLNVVKNVDVVMQAPPSAYAKELIAEAAASSSVREAPWVKSQGPFRSHGVVITTPDLVKGDFVTHMLAIGNDSTGTLYLLTFESPVEDWAQASAIAEPMLKRLWIDSEI